MQANTSTSNVLLSNSAQSPRGVFSFIGSLLAAAWGATLASSAPAWGSNRAWLPFVRARNYMRSRQSLLDYSLTYLYRVAERHRG